MKTPHPTQALKVVPLEHVFVDERANLRAFATNEADGDGPDPDQALRESIAKDGVLQPVGVARDETLDRPFRYRLVFGFRRFRAASAVGLEAIPITLVGGDEQTLGLVNLTENMVRADLEPFELMEALHRLRQAHADLSTADLARASGRSQTHVANLLRLRQKLSPDMLGAYRERGASMHLRHLLSVCTLAPEEQARKYNELVTGTKGGRPTGSVKPRKAREPATSKQVAQWLAKARREQKKAPSAWLSGVLYALKCVAGRESFTLAEDD